MQAARGDELRPLVLELRQVAGGGDRATGPRRRDAFDTGRPVSSEIAVWYSNITCSPPCEISGWYGVYGVRNSERWMIESISAGT